MTFKSSGKKVEHRLRYCFSLFFFSTFLISDISRDIVKLQCDQNVTLEFVKKLNRNQKSIKKKLKILA